MWVTLGDSAYCIPTHPMIEPSSNATTVVSGLGHNPGRTQDPGAEALRAAMDRFATGDDGAFEELYRRGAPRVRGFLTRLCGDRDLADDLTQDVFLRIHRARGSFVPGAPAIPWMLAIARNALRDHARRAQVRRPLQAAAEGVQQDRVASPDGRGDEVLVAREVLDVVRRALAQMPALHREAFVLLRFEGLSVGEAAQVLGASEGAVKVRAFRAYEALRAALDESQSVGGQAHAK
jgi:RNA polymerase sigma-70 factor (ECF subfamily)